MEKLIVNYVPTVFLTFKPQIGPVTLEYAVGLPTAVLQRCLFDEDRRKSWKRNIKTRPPALY